MSETPPNQPSPQEPPTGGQPGYGRADAGGPPGASWPAPGEPAGHPDRPRGGYPSDAPPPPAGPPTGGQPAHPGHHPPAAQPPGYGYGQPTGEQRGYSAPQPPGPGYGRPTGEQPAYPTPQPPAGYGRPAPPFQAEHEQSGTGRPGFPPPSGQPGYPGRPHYAGHPGTGPQPGHAWPTGEQPQPPRAGGYAEPGDRPGHARSTGEQPAQTGYPGPGFGGPGGYPPQAAGPQSYPPAGAPQPAAGPQQPTEGGADEITWSMIAHLSGVIMGCAGWLPALVVYLLRRGRPGPSGQRSFVRHHAAEALNFQLTLVVPYLVMWAVYIGLGMYAYTWSWIGSLLIVAVWLVSIVLGILAAVGVTRGRWYRYPVAVRLVR
ncbi:DUF4870 domain-containing protein [Marinactinospora rubrisoli]|uniref:DUF4870 domain-containing protein n=1 Tax=Marinactinospora rubrisoli TaxID=2715399 RepID=A0ABW2KJW3_9ACTN